MRRLAFALLAALVTVVLVMSSVTATGATNLGGQRVRWDLIQIVGGSTVLAGGQDVSKDAATGDEITLTGSGQVLPSNHSASGDGTFVHMHANGSEVAHGFYIVTGYRSFRDGHGQFPVTDGITNGLGRPHGGILSLNVKLVPLVNDKPQPAGAGVLTIYCALAKNTLGLKDTQEGFTLKSGPFNFRQEGKGITLFQILK
jgi:hypothetical protein